jgi:hypothetical protein
VGCAGGRGGPGADRPAARQPGSPAAHRPAARQPGSPPTGSPAARQPTDTKKGPTLTNGALVFLGVSVCFRFPLPDNSHAVLGIRRPVVFGDAY